MSAEAQAPEQEAALVESGSLLDSILNETRLKPSDEGFDVAKRGVEAFISELLSSSKTEKVDQSLIDLMIAEIDQKLSKQVDAILHNEEVQAIESTWRGLKYLVDHTDFRENIQIELISAKKDEVLDDFEDAPEVVKSGLYKQIYTREYGQFGGKPVGAVICDFSLSASSPDIKLMEYMANVGAMSHAPFITSASAKFFGLDSYEELPNLKDLKSVFEGPQYTKWRGLREHEDARYLGLCTSRFMLRTPYSVADNPIKAFDYDEQVTDSHDNYLWGNSAYAMASKISESFAKYRWCPNIIGPQSGGAVHDLPVYNFEAMGQIETKIPTEILVSDRREYELAEEGFIALTMRKGSDNAAFFSANSVQKPKVFANTPEGKQAEMNYKLGTQLPYMFIINRLAHYIKVLQREQIGSWKERSDLEIELNKWIRQYVSDQENPPAEVRGRRPLRAAKVEVSDVEGDPGWYRVSMSVRPHFKYMGASFDLSLVGKLDQ
ncbi:type VI secretion system contractile sheath large subunit [Vibrio vulnificus]|uniref:type VI secretion system contractile sheath large subunit n=1 Tax=Vibrio vulnificus TaxID=672 RepID=UPI001E4D4FDF|nr:type VI secretion system contractile sheath large subunit [Vibrio vulnificus]EHH3081823.1 type VI secretion system contractile sheath large subunit [Vibrio vulnificus]EHZ2653436.1 type VI secretion system contractile sheath large subunit [Vibrio vulnificus]EIZ1003945.1 type VI secretion system contractile sheath large subunit [Vibrio vulnificus]EIZ1173143.1 type VI secretion system contractile sheath large subunit [Vibrio vulnificus]EJB5268598.1 type VI secretion system contractile sheath l